MVLTHKTYVFVVHFKIQKQKASQALAWLDFI
jgi:hypothetical protein